MDTLVLYYYHFILVKLYFLLLIIYISITRSNELIFEAFSTLKEPNGLDTSTIASFIEVFIEVHIFIVLNNILIILILLIQRNLAFISKDVILCTS